MNFLEIFCFSLRPSINTSEDDICEKITKILWKFQSILKQKSWAGEITRLRSGTLWSWEQNMRRGVFWKRKGDRRSLPHKGEGLSRQICIHRGVAGCDAMIGVFLLLLPCPTSWSFKRIPDHKPRSLDNVDTNYFFVWSNTKHLIEFYKFSKRSWKLNLIADTRRVWIHSTRSATASRLSTAKNSSGRSSCAGKHFDNFEFYLI